MKLLFLAKQGEGPPGGIAGLALEHLTRYYEVLGMRKDFQLKIEERLCLLFCGNGTEDIMRLIDCDEIDYELLGSICIQQRVYPQFVKAVEYYSLMEKLNDLSVKRIREYKQRTYLGYFRYTKEIERIQSRLRDANINFMFIKGISYYPMIYTSVLDRSLGDIDLVVAREDLLSAVHILDDIGYKPDTKNKGWADDVYISESEWNLHVAQLVNQDGYEVEVHVATFYYTALNLKKIMSGVMQKNQKYAIPSFEDTFLIACVHAWHHFPIRMNPLKTGFNQLGQLLDVYYGYQAMKKYYSYDEVMHIAREAGIQDIVEFMIYCACLLLDHKDGVDGIQLPEQTAALIDWVHIKETVPLAYRLFRGSEIADRSERWLAETERKVICRRKGKADPILLCPEISCPKGGWYHNILEAGSFDIFDMKGKVKLEWDERGLYCYIWFPEMLVQNDLENFDYYCTHLIIRYSKNRIIEPQYLALQVCQGNLKCFFWDNQKGWLIKPVIHPNIMYYKEHEYVICRIPWSVIGFEEVQSGARFFFDLQGKLVKKRAQHYVDISMLAGNNGCLWNENKTSNYLGVLELGD